jgi:hypothetical protein
MGKHNLANRLSLAVACVVALASLSALGGCAAAGGVPAGEFVRLPLSHAWFDGELVDYVTTDASDKDVAMAVGANYVERLADAIAAPMGHGLTDKVYKFTGGEQWSVFGSAPKPVGPLNQRKFYTPLWNLALVSWNPGFKPRRLDSEEMIWAAVEKGEVSVAKTKVVINCPVVRTSAGGALPKAD